MCIRDRSGRDHVGAATSGDQKEDLPYVDAGVVHQGGDVGELLKIGSHDRGVYLHREAVALQGRNRLEGVVEVPGDPSHAVVRRGAGTVEAEGHRLDAVGPKRLEVRVRELGRHRGRQRHGHAALLGVGDEFDDVGALQAVAAGEYQDRTRTADRRHLVDESAPLGAREFVRPRVGLRAGATVEAREIAGLGHLPEDQQRPVVELARTVGLPVDQPAARIHLTEGTVMPCRVVRGHRFACFTHLVSTLQF